MSERPSIPAEVVREILVESGHRCAVCGAGLPLERAHIIPWHKSRMHRAEDLICLCANCHQRADLEGWSEKTLREYKLRPWVVRASRMPESTRTVELRIEPTGRVQLRRAQRPAQPENPRMSGAGSDQPLQLGWAEVRWPIDLRIELHYTVTTFALSLFSAPSGAIWKPEPNLDGSGRGALNRTLLWTTAKSRRVLHRGG